ncbi:hypothetical protein H1R20_g13032, partial [Candolleomyces eurysporus]
MSKARLPKLIAFDLEHNEPISFYKDVPEILHKIREWRIDDAPDGSDGKILIAACSRTDAPRLANQCLNLLLVPPSASQSRGLPAAAITFFDELEIYPGSKLTHFRRLNQKTGIDYEDMKWGSREVRSDLYTRSLGFNPEGV